MCKFLWILASFVALGVAVYAQEDEVAQLRRRIEALKRQIDGARGDERVQLEAHQKQLSCALDLLKLLITLSETTLSQDTAFCADLLQLLQGGQAAWEGAVGKRVKERYTQEWERNRARNCFAERLQAFARQLSMAGLPPNLAFFQDQLMPFVTRYFPPLLQGNAAPRNSYLDFAANLGPADSVRAFHQALARWVMQYLQGQPLNVAAASGIESSLRCRLGAAILSEMKLQARL